jgi:tight adherence protein C
MNNAKILILAAVFVLIFGAAVLAMLVFTRDPVKHRLSALDERESAAREPSHDWLQRLSLLAAPLAKLSVPAEGWENSPVRLRFINAGWRGPSTPGLFHACKTALTVGLPLLTWLLLGSDPQRSGSMTFLSLAIAGAFGYYAPDIVLKRRIASRQQEIFETFPDALDLMTVCVEAGLAMDAALARVGAEIGLKSVVLAEELQLVTLELRAGSAKDKALRNLALRTGVEDVDALVTLLIQADRFGTSIADSLRVQSDQLRVKRRQRAEEQAAKVSLKLLFPLIFFIFPSLFVVLLGPAALSLYRNVLQGS